MLSAETQPTQKHSSSEKIEDLQHRLARMKSAQRARPAPTLDERLDALAKLRASVVSHKEALVAALCEDFGNRSRHETLLAEVYATIKEIDYASKHLAGWMTDDPRAVEAVFLPARAEVRYQPIGVVGVISPWNYPVYLSLSPLVGALAAGNRALLKPSELVPATAELLATMLAEAFSSDQVYVVTGDASVGEGFSKLPLDHLLFTGSTRVGKLVMRAASENLVPVTLELGGKSPVIVHESVSIDRAAHTIMTGKLLNAGQTCIAPDYALVAEHQRDAFVSAAQRAVQKLYPTLADNSDYTSIINEKQAGRLRGWLEDARAKGATVIECNPRGETLDGRRMAPTIVTGATDEMTLLQEEIFGPILPVVTYRALDEAIDYVNARPRPLALYYFDNDRSRIERVLDRTVSGGACVNDTLLHVVQDSMPFGGVGPSGMGAYHGRSSFLTFSHAKGVFHQARINGSAVIRAPYGRIADATIKWLTR